VGNFSPQSGYSKAACSGFESLPASFFTLRRAFPKIGQGHFGFNLATSKAVDEKTGFES
jgi:hypothetical protein